MIRQTAFSIALLFLAFVPQAATRAASEQTTQGTLHLSVRIYDYAEPCPKLLDRAKQEASRVLAQAGIETDWLNCPLTMEERETNPACSVASGPTDLVIRILPPAMHPAVSSRTETFGHALVGSQTAPRMASILFGNVERLAWARDTESGYGTVHRSVPHERYVGILLGHVVAHEIGHLLLASNKHSRGGLMQPRWNARVTEQAITRPASLPAGRVTRNSQANSEAAGKGQHQQRQTVTDKAEKF